MILTSPEMVVENMRFRSLISQPTWAQNVLSLIVDEAHCISQWGDQFRTLYKNVGDIRALFPHPVPVLATSATMELGLSLYRFGSDADGIRTDWASRRDNPHPHGWHPNNPRIAYPGLAGSH